MFCNWFKLHFIHDVPLSDIPGVVAWKTIPSVNNAIASAIIMIFRPVKTKKSSDFTLKSSCVKTKTRLQAHYSDYKLKQLVIILNYETMCVYKIPPLPHWFLSTCFVCLFFFFVFFSQPTTISLCVFNALPLHRDENALVTRVRCALRLLPAMSFSDL